MIGILWNYENVPELSKHSWITKPTMNYPAGYKLFIHSIMNHSSAVNYPTHCQLWMTICAFVENVQQLSSGQRIQSRHVHMRTLCWPQSTYLPNSLNIPNANTSNVRMWPNIIPQNLCYLNRVCRSKWKGKEEFAKKEEPRYQELHKIKLLFRVKPFIQTILIRHVTKYLLFFDIFLLQFQPAFARQDRSFSTEITSFVSMVSEHKPQLNCHWRSRGSDLPLNHYQQITPRFAIRH